MVPKSSAAVEGSDSQIESLVARLKGAEGRVTKILGELDHDLADPLAALAKITEQWQAPTR